MVSYLSMRTFAVKQVFFWAPQGTGLHLISLEMVLKSTKNLQSKRSQSGLSKYHGKMWPINSLEFFFGSTLAGLLEITLGKTALANMLKKAKRMQMVSNQYA